MEVLARVVTIRTATDPLENDMDIGIGGGDVLLPERELEAELTRIDVACIEHNVDASRDLALDFRDLGTNDGGVVVVPTSRLDVESCIDDRADRTGCHGGRCHLGHDCRSAEEVREGCVNVQCIGKD